MADAVALMDKDLAAKTLEPVITLMFDQLASDVYPEVLEAMLPIDVEVAFTLHSGERKIAHATFASQITELKAVM